VYPAHFLDDGYDAADVHQLPDEYRPWVQSCEHTGLRPESDECVGRGWLQFADHHVHEDGCDEWMHADADAALHGDGRLQQRGALHAGNNMARGCCADPEHCGVG
jgi:hypothetical protein